MNEDILIRKISLVDIEVLQSLGIATFTETFSSVNSKEDLEAYLSDGFSREKLKKELDNPESEFYLADLNGEAVAYLKVNTGNAQTEQLLDDALEIERIYVLNEFHGKRIGKLLFNKAMDIARQNNNKRVWLGVWEENRKAIEFYQRQGFETFDTHIFQLGDDAQTDWLMKLEI